MSDISNLSASEKGELMHQVQQQIALANVQELLTKMTEKCFNKCIVKPGASLGSAEQKCILMCTDRFMDSRKVVTRAYGSRLQQNENTI